VCGVETEKKERTGQGGRETSGRATRNYLKGEKKKGREKKALIRRYRKKKKRGGGGTGRKRLQSEQDVGKADERWIQRKKKGGKEGTKGKKNGN